VNKVDGITWKAIRVSSIYFIYQQKKAKGGIEDCFIMG